MTLQQLEYVMAVYRCKHFAKAADYCNVTQPTLSSMIQKLEEELGVKIFDRRKQPIKPTVEGMLIIERAWNILVRAKQLKEVIEEERQILSGTFHIAVLPTIAPYLIPRFLPQLMNDYPQLDIRVSEMKTEDIHRALKHGDIDAGIVAEVEVKTILTDNIYTTRSSLFMFQKATHYLKIKQYVHLILLVNFFGYSMKDTASANSL